MENFENKVQEENSFVSNAEVNDYLLETSKWGKFLAIAGYIGMGLFIVIAIFMMFGFSKMSSFSGKQFPTVVMGIIYIIIAVIYYFPVNYLYKFSVKIKQGLNSKDMSSVTSGFQNLKSLFKFMGISMIVVFSIYVLALLVAIPSMLFLNH